MNSSAERMTRWAHRLLNVAVPLLLLAWGMYSFPLALFGPDRSKIPGDLGDSRFINYILEHFHQYAIGNEKSYWDAPFMYPYTNVTALSENLLGTAPIYSVFRFGGFNRESAYQLWILALFSLNYIGCFIALRLWSKHTVLSACGAYIFAFGIYNIGQLDHMQVFPKFMVPFAMYFFWRALDQRRAIHLALAALSVVYQFYCGIYLGFMVLYCMLFMFAAHVIFYRRSWFVKSSFRWRGVSTIAAIAVVSAELLYPLLHPYMLVSNTLGMRHFEDIIATIPHVPSYFFTHPAASSWHILSEHSKFAFPEWWSHFLFMGAVPWAAILALPVVLLSKRVASDEKRRIAWLSLVLLLSIVFCVNMSGHTLYKFIFDLPGFSALRAIDRIINVEAVLFIALFVLVFRSIPVNTRSALLLGPMLAGLVVLDQRVDTNELKRYDKYDAQELVKKVEREMVMEHDTTYKVIAYTPILSATEDELVHTRTIETELTAMLAAQHLHLPIVNAYTGSYPGNYISFFDHMDQKTLDDWCAFNHTTSEHIQCINNVGQGVLGTDLIQLKAANDRFVCADIVHENMAVADRDKAALWETFVRIHLADGHYALLAHNGNFLCAEILSHQEVSATGQQLGDFGMFWMEPASDGRVAFKAHNGRYLSLDTSSSRLFATAESVGVNERFQVIDAPPR